RQFLFRDDAVDRAANRALLQRGPRALELKLGQFAVLLLAQQILLGDFRLGANFLELVLGDDEAVRLAVALEARLRQPQPLLLRIDPGRALRLEAVEVDRRGLDGGLQRRHGLAARDG